MEYVEGVNASQLMHKMDLFPAQIAYVTQEVLKALDFLHNELDVIHRDVKPDNVLVSYGGDVKLCDLGISIKASEEKGPMIGSLPYMAPAVFTDPNYRHCVDIWSLGMTVYTLRERKVPYTGLYHTNDELKMMITANMHRPKLSPCPQDMANFYNCVTILYKSMTAWNLLQHYWLPTAVKKPEFSSAIREAYFTSNYSDEQCTNLMASLTLPKAN